MPDVDADVPDESPTAAQDRWGGIGSLGSIIYLLMLTWAAAIASFPLNDNSFFTHLATGRIILDEGAVPSTDPYTFTAHGLPWTVQSWLASVAYAGAERLGGDVGLRVVVLATFMTAATVLWKLTSPARSIVVRVLLLSVSVLICTGLWSERPYMIGVIGVGVVWLALEGRVRPWSLVPLMWLWVNTHGSWLLALVLVAATVTGGAIDRRTLGASELIPKPERKVVRGVVLGMLLGIIGPLGLRAMTFPVRAFGKSDVFAEIIEWRSPTYRSIAEQAFLALVTITVLLLVRKGSWRLTLPAVAFAVGGIYAQRNIVMAVVVLLAAAASSAPQIGSLRAKDRPSLGGAATAFAGVVLLAVGAAAIFAPALPTGALGGYPARALAWTAAHDAGAPLAASASTGNLLEVLDGAERLVFIDDRVDMFPTEVFQDSLQLTRGASSWAQVLDGYGLDVAVFSRDSAVSSLLAADGDWAVVYSDSLSTVACRRGSGCGELAANPLP